MLLEHPESYLIDIKLHPMTIITTRKTLIMTWQLCRLYRLPFLLKFLKILKTARRVLLTLGFVGIQMTFLKTEQPTRLVKRLLLLQIAIIAICIKKLVHGLSCFLKLQDVPHHQKRTLILIAPLHHPSRIILLEQQQAL
jgi:hypothetical protein